jgi:two-component system, OmpR family, response regulator
MAEPRPSILLVDDDVILCRGLCRSLKQHGFDVHAVHCAADTVEHLKGNSVDIILLDWILPDRDGVALLQHIRSRGISTPVIMLTGEDTVQGRVRALNRGADDYLAKPFDIEELIARVHAHVRRASGTLINSRAGRISVDAWKQEASVDGERIDLTPIEYAILARLVRNADELVARWQLIEAAWTEKGAEGSSKALDIHLMRLRRKLGDAAAQIETVRGTGVRLHSGHRATG